MEHLPGGPPEDSEAAREAAKHINLYAFTLLGLFFLALFHVGTFRRGLLWACLKTWHGLALALPRPAHRVFASSLGGPHRAKQALAVLLSIPHQTLVLGRSLYAWIALFRTDLRYRSPPGVSTFVAISLLLNSRWLGLCRRSGHGQPGAHLAAYPCRSPARPGALGDLSFPPFAGRNGAGHLYAWTNGCAFVPVTAVCHCTPTRPRSDLVLSSLTFFVLIFNLFVEPTFNPIKHFPDRDGDGQAPVADLSGIVVTYPLP